MILRPAVPEDALACAAILRAWIAETPWFRTPHPPSSDAPALLARIERGEVTVADAHGEVLGFVAVRDDYVACLYVRGDARGRGVGRRLLDHAKRGCAALRLWTFEANARAHAFYRREGFAELSRTDGDNEEGLPDIEFGWFAAAPAGDRS